VNELVVVLVLGRKAVLVQALVHKLVQALAVMVAPAAVIVVTVIDYCLAAGLDY